MDDYLHLRCPCGMTLEVARAAAGTPMDCPHCGRKMMVPFPEDPERDRLIGTYAGSLELKPHAPPPCISGTLLGVMRSALKSIRIGGADAPATDAALAAQVEAFREAVVHGLTVPGFRMVDEAQKIGVGRTDVGAVVKDVYRAFFRKCVEDGFLSTAEREAMAVVAQRMCLHPAKKAELEAEVTGGVLRERLAAMAQDGRLDPGEAESLRLLVRAAGQDWEACVRQARDVAIQMVEQRFAFARADGRITRDEANEIRRLQDYFHLVGRDIGYVEEQLNALRLLSAYQEGSLPVVDPPATVTGLAEDELCHAVETVWLAVPLGTDEPRGEGVRDGARRATLVLTHQRVLLPGEPDGSLPLERLAPVRDEFVAVRQEGVVRRRRFLHLSASEGGATFRVTAHDHERLRSLLEGAVRNAAKARSRPVAAPAAAQIAAGVRTQVWRRDRGVCSLCGASQGLEFAPTRPDARLDDPEAFRIVCQACRGK